MSLHETARDVTIPAQIRAGRALLDWSQVQLAEAAGISVSTVKAFESGRPGKQMSAAGPMRSALERAGLVFLPSNEQEGPGVRLPGALPNIIRRPLGRDFYEQIGFTVEWRGQKIRVQLPSDVLDDLDRTRQETDEHVVASFDRHRHKILEAIVAAASDQARLRPTQEYGMLQLVPGDFLARR